MELIKAALPVVVMLLVGMLMREKKIISDEGINGIQTLVINVTLPISLFSFFYKKALSPSQLIYPLTFFILTVGGLFLGKLICKATKEKDKIMPFALSGYEIGMLGYALLGILAGNVTTMAIMDIGHSLAIFTIYIGMLKATVGQKQTARETVLGLLKMPMLVGILLGAILGITGIGETLNKSPAGPVIDNLCAFISAPTNAAILLTIGYRLKFKGLNWPKIFKVSGIKVVMQAIFGVIVFLIYRKLGGDFASTLTTMSLIMILVLPSPFVFTMYIEDEEDKEFYSSQVSFHTLIAVAAFIIMAAVYL